MERARTIEERHAYALRDGRVVCVKCGKLAHPVGRLGLLWDNERCPSSGRSEPQSDSA
ncbi:MAG: hypothetical protein QXH42_01000 [Thermoplasmata archaeon]